MQGWQEVMDHPWFSKGFHEERRRSYHELDTVRYRAAGGFCSDNSDANSSTQQVRHISFLLTSTYVNVLYFVVSSLPTFCRMVHIEAMEGSYRGTH